MAVSKSLRYEVLRRDNYACRYCGASAPDVKLHVDHVVATTLGGSDDPSNLVAACTDCNSGKSSTPAGAPLIADVAQDALRWAAAMQIATAARMANLEAKEAYLAAFRDKWNGWRTVPAGELIELPNDWTRTIGRWYSLQFPLELLCDAVDRAMTKRALKGYDPEFRYMAGIVWSTITEIQHEAAAVIAHEDAEPPPGDWRSTPDARFGAEQHLLLASVCDVAREIG